MKTLLTILIVLFGIGNSFVFAQPAPQTPAWTLPLYFEDAIGQKDTLYLGYDSRANSINLIFDTIFDEKCELADTSKFWASFASCSSFYANKINIVSDTGLNGCLLYSSVITFEKANFPVIVRYDANLFYTDSLPFNSTSTPIAYGAVGCSFPISCIPNNPSFLMSDVGFIYSPVCDFNTPSFGWYCHSPDSFVLGQSGEFGGGSFDVTICPYPNPIGIGELSLSSVTIHPNPTNGRIIISLEERTPTTITIRNSLGQLLLAEKHPSSNKIVLDISIYPSGLYFLQVESEGEVYYRKLIKE